MSVSGKFEFPTSEEKNKAISSSIQFRELKKGIVFLSGKDVVTERGLISHGIAGFIKYSATNARRVAAGLCQTNYGKVKFEGKDAVHPAVILADGRFQMLTRGQAEELNIVKKSKSKSKN